MSCALEGVQVMLQGAQAATASSLVDARSTDSTPRATSDRFREIGRRLRAQSSKAVTGYSRPEPDLRPES